METKVCTKCGTEKALADFRPRKAGRLGRSSECRECYRKRSAKYQREKRTRDRKKREDKRENILLKVKEVYLSYIAGIVDGEGSIGIAKSQRAESFHGYYYVAKICITNTCVDLLDFVSKTLGIGSLREKKRGSGLGRKACYEWTVTSRKAGDVAEAICPFLIVKKKQAQIVIKFQELTRSRSWLRMDEKSKEDRDALYSECRLLNGRGELR